MYLATQLLHGRARNTELTRKARNGQMGRIRPGRWLSALLVAVGLVSTAPAMAAGLMSPVNGQSPLNLDEQHVEVVIENGYATTSVEQIFSNPHAQDLEALYSFPVPRAAAVGEFTYWIDGQPVHAEVVEKARARQLYEQQKAQGQEAGLVEQDENRTFDARVYPVRANDSVRIRLVYLQRNAVDHSVGRYLYPLEDGGVDVERNSFWARNDRVEQAFSFRLKLRSAWPVDAVRVPNGSARVQQLDSGEWEVELDASTGNGAAAGAGLDDAALARAGALAGTGEHALGQAASHDSTRTSRQRATGDPAWTLDQDIVVYWRLAENLPGAVELVSYRAPQASHGTFMLTLTPGIDLQPISEGRDWVFILDMSGSMQGKYQSLLDGVSRALGALNPADRFRIVLFHGRAEDFTRGYQAADKSSVSVVLQGLEQRHPDGSTALYDGLKEGLRGIDADRTTALVLVTDGVANVGPTALEKFLKLMDKRDIRLFTAVMGNSANEPLLGSLTRHAEGFAVNVSNADDMVGLMLQMTSKVTHEALHNVRVSIDGVSVSGLTPERSNRVYRGEQLVMLGQYRGQGKARVTVKTEISGQSKTYRSTLEFPELDTRNPELERLWGFATIEALQEQQRLVGENEDTRQAITDMAIQHGLLTEQTSLVAVRDEVLQANGIQRDNAQRIGREHQARAARGNQTIVVTQQDAAQPMFTGQRHTTSNGSGGKGGGSIGLWVLLGLMMIAAGRLGSRARVVIERPRASRRR